MNRSSYIPILLLLISMTWMSCEYDFEVDVPRRTQNVVLANFTPEEQLKVYVSSTVPIGNIDSSSMKYPNTAEVVLFSNGEFEERLAYTPGHNGNLPYYRSSKKINPSTSYEIEVDVEGNPISSASNKVPKGLESVNAEIISVEENVDQEFSELVNVTLNVALNIEDNTLDEFYYHIKGSAYEEDFTDLSVSNEIDHLRILHEEGILIRMLNANSSNNRIELEVKFYYFPEFESKVPITIEVRKCSRDYYLFHRSVGEQELSNFRDGILSSQSVQIHNNIVDGVGNFSAYTVNDVLVEW